MEMPEDYPWSSNGHLVVMSKDQMPPWLEDHIDHAYDAMRYGPRPRKPPTLHQRLRAFLRRLNPFNYRYDLDVEDDYE